MNAIENDGPQRTWHYDQPRLVTCERRVNEFITLLDARNRHFAARAAALHDRINALFSRR